MGNRLHYAFSGEHLGRTCNRCRFDRARGNFLKYRHNNACPCVAFVPQAMQGTLHPAFFVKWLAMRSPQGEAWRRGESNPRPPKRHNSFYVCSLPLRSRLRDCQQTGPSRTPASCWFSLLHPAARCRNYPAVVAFILSAGVRGKTSSLYLGCECVLFVGTYCFCRLFYEANRHPRHATEAST